MIREQAPSTAPRASTGQQDPAPATPNSGSTVLQSAVANLPQFGVSSPLRPMPQTSYPASTKGNSQPASNASLYEPTLNSSFHAPALKSTPPNASVKAAKPVDKHANLFIPAKKVTAPTSNPLLRAIETSNGVEKYSAALPRKSEHDAVEIVPPRNQPLAFQTAAPPPIFSSQPAQRHATNSSVDFTAGTFGQLRNNDPVHNRFGDSDPYTYMDAGKATDDIKALLEGALDEEEERPRTRRKKQIMDGLASKMGRIDVKDAAERKASTGSAERGEKNAENDEDQEGDEDDEEELGRVEGLRVDLLPHQVDGVAWMQEKELGTRKTKGVFPKGGILADDMGLGKTIQSIALVLKNSRATINEAASKLDQAGRQKECPVNAKSTLVVAPLALIKQWEGEIQDRVEASHRLRTCVHHGPQRTKVSPDLEKYDVVITTYHTLVSEHGSSNDHLKAGCFGVKWHRIILDEAHSIKNRNAKATKAACALEARFRWCLTGTPMQNNLDELQSLIHFLRIKPYEDLNAWRDQITRPMSNGRGGLAIKRLQVYLRAFMKRRTKDILKQEGALRTGNSADKGDEGGGKSQGFRIVQRTVENVEAEFTPEERAFYDRLESRTDRSLEQMMSGSKMSYASALVLLLRLRQSCNHINLVKGDLSKERDAIVDGGDGAGDQTPSQKKKAVKNEDFDSIASMLGGLSVTTKRCDVCQAQLDQESASAGAIRCEECEADLAVAEMGRDAAAAMTAEKKLRSRSGNNDHALKKPEQQEEEEEEEEETSASDNNNNDEPILRTGEKPLLASTKIRHLLRLVRQDSHNHKYIIFSFFTSMLDLISPFLTSAGISQTRYDGSMPNHVRERNLSLLRHDPSTRVLLCSLRAGCLGLNLTAASRVIILEPFWNPFVEEQAIDRVHRLNQTRDVKVWRLLVKGTVEERIVELQEKKRGLAQAAVESGGRKKLGGSSAKAMKLSMDDMLKLFRHDGGHHHHHHHHHQHQHHVGDDDDGGQQHQPKHPPHQQQWQQRKKPSEHAVYGRRW